jgi:hypothetical protein
VNIRTFLNRVAFAMVICGLLPVVPVGAQQHTRWWQREVPQPTENQVINPSYTAKRRELEQAWDQLQSDMKAQRHFRSLGQRTPGIDAAIASSRRQVNVLEHELSQISVYITRMPDTGTQQVPSPAPPAVVVIQEESPRLRQHIESKGDPTNAQLSGREAAFQDLIVKASSSLKNQQPGSAYDFAVKASHIPGYKDDPDVQWLKQSAKEMINQFTAAAEKGNQDEIRRQIEGGLDISHPLLGGDALVKACIYGHMGIVRLLVTLTGKKFFSYRGWGTPLGSAAHKGHTDIVTYLLEKGADINYRPGDGDMTPLEEAISGVAFDGTSIDILEFLLKRGADPNATSHYQGETYTPLRHAYRVERNDIAEILRRYGAR